MLELLIIDAEEGGGRGLQPGLSVAGRKREVHYLFSQFVGGPLEGRLKDRFFGSRYPGLMEVHPFLCQLD